MKAPIFSSLFATKEVVLPLDVEAAALRSDRFRLSRQADWERLERIVKAMEAGKLRRLSDDDVLELPTLYRTATSSLSVARETSLDAATLAYLESLVLRAWFQVYGPRQGFIRWLRGFLGGGLSHAVRAIWPEILVALAVMIAGVVTGWLLVSGNQDWFYSIVPSGLTGNRVPGATREVLLQSLDTTKSASGLSFFAAYLFQNNASVSILAFALGFAFGVPTLLILLKEMASLGALLWLFASKGLEWQFVAWLSVHGTTELFAILLAGAAGLHVGRSMAFPGNRSIMAATAESGRRAAVVMAGVVMMLIVAALLESFARQLVGTTFDRLLIGGSMLAIWCSYFFAYRRDPSRGM